MSLVKISDTVLINTDKISSVESRKDKVLVWVDGRSYTVDVPLKYFMTQFGMTQQSSGAQHFAG